MPAPCEFIRNHKGEPEFHSYKENGNPTVLFVVGGPIDNSKTDSWMKSGCGTQLQAVFLRSGNISLAKKPLNMGPICPSWGMDEKFYSWEAREQ
jgi:hypothetical protein